VGELQYGRIDLSYKVMVVTLEGGDEHLVPNGQKTTAALDRYMLTRSRHAKAGSPWLRLGTRDHDTAPAGSTSS
jgi:site-specific recombinase XerD